MGIGEPLDNFTNVMDFISVVNDDHGLNIGARHITVSTSGLAHKIYEFADKNLQVNLAVSIHAPNNELRTKIMKINRAFPIEKLMAAIEYYIKKANRRITYEYIMLNDVNDHKEEAVQLAELLSNHRHLAYVNLIPYNAVSEHDQYKRSETATIQSFYRSEEHTSELQSRGHLVCRLLLVKKNSRVLPPFTPTGFARSDAGFGECSKTDGCIAQLLLRKSAAPKSAVLVDQVARSSTHVLSE